MRLVTALIALLVTAALFVGPAGAVAISIDQSDIAPDDEPEDCVESTEILDADSETDASKYADCLKEQYEYELRMDIVATIEWIETQWPDAQSEIEEAIASVTT
ncbi:hypothetical protein OB905_01545 [Halobacteria archaeon AArc-dxtr1]|nr:hypothetical protein [Halobacteria archaeon AArc-dxtr1]